MKDIYSLLGVLCTHPIADERDRAYSEIESCFREFQARAERAERERDDHFKAYVSAHGRAANARAWARRWKLAATEWRRGAIESFNDNRVLRARLEKWRTAERMTTYITSTGTFRIPGDAVIWARVPPLEE